MKILARRLALVFLLVVGASGIVMAQERSEPPSEANTEKATENSSMEMWKWINFVLLAAGWVIWSEERPGRVPGAHGGHPKRYYGSAGGEKRCRDSGGRGRCARADSGLRDGISFRAQSKSEMQQEGERIRQETARADRALGMRRREQKSKRRAKPPSAI